MSKLLVAGRPFTVFDPANVTHRAHYYKFVNTRSWGNCPVRFILTEEDGDLLTMIQRSLVSYYVKQEFDVAVKPQKTFVQKIKKLVDTSPV